MSHRLTFKITLIAFLGATLVTPGLQAQEIADGLAAPGARNAAQIIDVSLSQTGHLEGQYVNQQGRAVDGARVVVWKGQEKRAQAVTARDGRFTIAGLTNGVYRIESPGQVVLCRVWPSQAAPPSAKTAVVMVSRGGATRGQLGYLDPINTSTLILGIAGVTLGAIAVSDLNDLDGQVKSLNRKVDTLLSP